jgi:WD40 repeat protein
VIRDVAFDSQGDHLASVGNDGQLMLWERDGDSFRIVQQMQGAAALACARFSPDGSQIAAVGFQSEVFLIGRRPQPTIRLACRCGDLRAAAYRDDGQLLAVAGRSGDLHLYDPRDGRPLGDHPLHQARIHEIAFHHQSNQAICVAEDGSVSVFDTGGARLVQRVAVTTGKLFAVAVIDSQHVAVAGSDNVIRVVNTDQGRVTRRLEGHTGSVATLAVGGGVLLSGSFDATLRRWSLGQPGGGKRRIAEGDLRMDR